MSFEGWQQTEVLVWKEVLRVTRIINSVKKFFISSTCRVIPFNCLPPFCQLGSTKKRLAEFSCLINFEQHLLIIRQFRARETRGSHTGHYNCRRIFTSHLSFFIRTAVLMQRRREERRILSALPVTRTRDNYIASPHVELLKRKFRKKLVMIPVLSFTEKHWNFYFANITSPHCHE